MGYARVVVAQEVRILVVESVLGVGRHCNAAEEELVDREVYWRRKGLLVNRLTHCIHLPN